MNFTNYSIFLFWNIGKTVYEKENCCHNIIQKYSDYCSYFFGNSFLFTRENIRFMKYLYMNFPIYYSKMESFSWNQYTLLFQLKNKKERLFYFYLSLFFHSDYYETNDFIQNCYYHRI